MQKFVAPLIFFMLNIPLFSKNEKTAEHFVSLLETHDYWKRASSQGKDAAVPLLLAELQSTNPALNLLESYDRIHMDYGNQRRQRDPMHAFTILEMQFKEKKDIPGVNEDVVQKYPRCAGSLMFETLSDSEKVQVFPFWQYKELEHGEVMNWRHREYIEWYAIRYNKTVFILYTIPVAWMEDIPLYAEMLFEYLSADTPENMESLIQRLQMSKSRSPIDYDCIRALQLMLTKLGFDPGEADGKYGSKTEAALVQLLKKRNYLDSRHPDRNQIRSAVKAFQKQNNVDQSGCCDQATIDKFISVYQTERITE